MLRMNEIWHDLANAILPRGSGTSKWGAIPLYSKSNACCWLFHGASSATLVEPLSDLVFDRHVHPIHARARRSHPNQVLPAQIMSTAGNHVTARTLKVSAR